jgi:Fe2+ or Zn2+ uptake regulation protein
MPEVLPLLDQVKVYLRSKGYRHTKLRQKILEILEMSDDPLSVAELQSKLLNSELNPNKTSIYRELDMLVKEEVLSQVDLLEGMKRYEFQVGESKNHLVCNLCGEIISARLNSTISAWLDKFCRQYEFEMSKCLLEFFGTCKNCKTNHS